MKKYVVSSLLLVSTLLLAPAAYANISLGDVSNNALGVASGLAHIIDAGMYVLGLGFAVGALLKYKHHRDNPSQIPLSTPCTLAAVAAALIFLPIITAATGDTLFGHENNVIAGPAGIAYVGAAYPPATQTAS